MESCFYLLIFWIKNEMKALTAFPWDPDPREPSRAARKPGAPRGRELELPARAVSCKWVYS